MTRLSELTRPAARILQHPVLRTFRSQPALGGAARLVSERLAFSEPRIALQSAAMELRPTVLLAVTNRQAFLQVYYDNAGASGVWITGASSYDLGTQVDLEIAFAEEQIVLHTRGVVRAKRPDRGALRAGVSIDFLPGEAKTRELILEFARGRTDLVRRQSRRLPVVMDVDVVTHGRRRLECTEDFSREGALVTHRDPPEPGSVLTIVLKPQGHEPIELEAEVRWRRRHERPAIGVRFLFDDLTVAKKVNELFDVFRGRLTS